MQAAMGRGQTVIMIIDEGEGKRGATGDRERERDRDRERDLDQDGANQFASRFQSIEEVLGQVITLHPHIGSRLIAFNSTCADLTGH